MQIATDATWTLKEQRFLAAANPRHGIVSPPQRIQRSHADVPDVVHVGVPPTTDHRGRNPAGGVGRSLRAATLAALGEACERYAGACASPDLVTRVGAQGRRVGAEEFSLFTEAQRAEPGFPAPGLYADDCEYVEMYSLPNHEAAWVPAPLVLLRDFREAPVATSNGLAAAPSPTGALLRAIQEIVERDAFMSTWLHSVGARQVALAAAYQAEFAARGGSVTCFDLTPQFSPHPVAAVAATLPLQGRPRQALGIACRSRWSDAVEKAWLECVQGLLFAGWYIDQSFADRVEEPAEVSSFDQHAAFYTWHPERWAALPLFGGAMSAEPEPHPQRTSPADELRELTGALTSQGIRIFYRDLTTVDLRDLGIHVVRAVSPELTPLHCHERFPFLGGTTADVGRRYPWFTPASGRYPNPLPHPLG